MANKGRKKKYDSKTETKTLGYRVPNEHREEIAERWKAILLEYAFMDGEVVPNPIPREIASLDKNIWDCGEVYKIVVFKTGGKQIIKFFTSFDKAKAARDILKGVKVN